MNNHRKTKRLKIAREKSWSTLTEESKQPIVQMLQYKSDNDNHKGGMNNAVKKKGMELSTQQQHHVSRTHDLKEKDNCSPHKSSCYKTFSLQKNMSLSSKSKFLNTTNEVASINVSRNEEL